MSPSTDPSAEVEYRISLIAFEGKTVRIQTYWTDEGKYALLSAALGEPDVESIYGRDYINDTKDAVVAEGVHMTKDDDDPE